jgi:hypothetical protein
MLKTRFVCPEISAPFFNQRYLKGPAPLAVVANTAPSPTHRVKLANAVAVVFENTVSVAQLVTALQGPETSTQYLPAEPADTFDNVN